MEALRPVSGDSVLSTMGVTWVHLRSILRPGFVRARISNLMIYEEVFQEFATFIQKDSSM